MLCYISALFNNRVTPQINTNAEKLFWIGECHVKFPREDVLIFGVGGGRL